MADPTRMDAAFTWVSKFYGPEYDLTMTEKPEEFWKEHIPSLAHLCKTKVAKIRVAESAEEAYAEAKSILQSLDEIHAKMGRWKELDPAAAAAGDRTAIYKFIVLVFHCLSSSLEDYITESEQFVAKNGIQQPFVDLLEDVNSSTAQWWQGVSHPPESPVHKVATPENSSFGKYSSTDIPSTPRTPFIRRGYGTPLSPIQNALNSPLTLKVKKDEYQRMRNSLAETEHLLDEERMKVLAARKDCDRSKNELREWREKFEQAEDQRDTYYRKILELEDTIEKLHQLNEKAISDGRDIRSRFDKQRASLQELEAERLKWNREKEHQAAMKTDMERNLRDLKEELQALETRHWSLQSHHEQTQKTNETLTKQVQEKVIEIDTIRTATRQAAQQKEMEWEEAISREGELRLQLGQTRSEVDDLNLKLRDKEIEVNEVKSAYNRDLTAAQETASSQTQELLERIKTLTGLLDESNGLLAAKEARLRELQEMTLSETRDVEKYNTELVMLRRELEAAQNINHALEQKIAEKSHDVQQAYAHMDELEKKFLFLMEEQRVMAENRQNSGQVEVHESEEASIPEQDVSAVASESHLEPVSLIEEQEEGFNHLCDEGNEDEDNQHAVVVGKTLGGGEYERLMQEELKRELNQEVDKKRIQELNARNSQVAPAHRCSYALELANYESPSGSSTEAKIKAPLQQSVSFVVPHFPKERLSKASSKAYLDADKENISISSANSKKSSHYRRSSIVHDLFGSFRSKK